MTDFLTKEISDDMLQHLEWESIESIIIEKAMCSFLFNISQDDKNDSPKRDDLQKE